MFTKAKMVDYLQREGRRYTQREMAAALNVTYQYVSLLCKDFNIPVIATHTEAMARIRELEAVIAGDAPAPGGNR